ncbi:MAG: transporter [Sphingomonadales bacterium]|nr:transporter [Sphingomonadales bacterium]
MNSGSDRNTGDKSGEWRKGWPLVLTAALASGIGPFHTWSLGAMMLPLNRDFGWTRAQISAGAFIVSVVGLLAGPLTGWLIDRVGARRIGLISPWLFAAGLVLIGQTGPAIWTWYAAFALIAVVTPAVTALVWSTAIVSRFDVQRGLALGVVISGIAVLGGMVPIYMTWAITVMSWRLAYASLGAIALLATVIPVYFFFYEASDLVRRGRGDLLPRGAAATIQQGMTFSDAARTARFWKLLVVLVVLGGVSGFFSVHLLPLLTDAGITPQTAAFILTGIVPAVIVARITTGALLDRVFAPYVLVGVLVLPIVACILLATQAVTIPLGWLIAILVGWSLGAEGDVIPFLTSRYFGRRSYSAIYGSAVAAFTLGYGTGPLIGGAVQDATGSYYWLMVGSGVALLATMAVVLTLGPYTVFASEDTE